jgi:predicted dehydrogenase
VTRVAIVGTGFWGTKLAEAVHRSTLELTACYSRGEHSRREFAERFDCRPAASLDEAVDSCDALLVATPNDDHEGPTLVAAARGKHVFVEKPIASTVEAGERMRDACAAAGVALLVGHELRRLGAARRAKEIVESGELGTVVLAEANFSLPSPLKPGTWKEGRGTPLVQLGVHHADTLQYLLGPVVRTTGRAHRLVSAADIDDTSAAILELASGALATITSSMVSPKTYSLRLLGTDAVLDYRADASVWPAAERLDATTTLTVGGEAVAFAEVDPLVDELEELGRCARGDATPETGAAEGLAALRVILDALASAAS